MNDRTDPPRSRLIFLLVFTALAMTLVAISYVVIQRNRQAPAGLIDSPTASPLRSPQPDALQRLRLLMALLLVTVLGIIAFVIGSYLAIRFGRNLVTKNVAGKPTEYVDAWAKYRLSPEELEAVGHVTPDESDDHDRPSDPGGSSPHDDPPEDSDDGGSGTSPR